MSTVKDDGAATDPRRGAPARFGPANVLRGIGAVRTGEIVSLNLPLVDPQPPFGRSPLRRTMRLHNDVRPIDGGRYVVINDDEVSFALQGSSQWDSFAHFGLIEPGSEAVYHGPTGYAETFRTDSADTVGIQALGPAIVGRGVLLDMVAALGADGFLPPETRITRDDVLAALERQRISILPGDTVLLFTGFEAYRRSIGGAFPAACAGLDRSSAGLWQELDILAIASDNLAVEAVPADFSIHIAVLRDAGIPIGELWSLEALAAACRLDERYDFLLASVPLNIHGAFGSTANAVAIR